MGTIGVVLLAIIAYFVWKIYNQREQERNEAKVEVYREKTESEEREMREKYPHLVGKIEGNWLDVFAHHVERNIPLLKLAFLLYLQESTKIDLSEGSFKWDNLWDLSEELLEHLEQFHEGSTAEHEIALCTYWQIATEAAGELIRESPEKMITESGRDSAPIDGKQLEVEPYTNIERITSLFPRKINHPTEEISFTDENAVFPRKSEGSIIIKNKLKSLGL